MSAREVRRARYLVLLAALVPVLAAAACTSSEGTRSPDDDPASDVTPFVGFLDPTRKGPAPAVPGATNGGVITARIHELPTMDPTEAYYTSSISILSGLVTRSLTQYVYDERSGGMVLIPDLATDLGTPNEDYTEWTFTIRPGIRYEDGTEVTVDDIAYGIKRSFDHETFPELNPYSTFYFLHGDSYQGPYKSGTDYEGVKVDGNRITLTMGRPFPDMPYYATFPAIGPILEDRSDPRTYARHPLATGPYKFAAYKPGVSLTLVRNDQWDPDTDPGRHQYVDEFRFRLHAFDDPRTAQTILDDTADGRTTIDLDQPPVDVLQEVLRHRPDLLATATNSCVYTLAINTRKITDVRVRKAIGDALPYQEALAAAGQLDGVTRVPGSTLLPPGSPGYTPYNPLSRAPGTTDPETSRERLQTAGYRPGEFVLRFLYMAKDPTEVALKNALVSGFEAGGFKVSPYATSTWEQFDAVREDPDNPLNLSRAGGWCEDWPAGDQSLVAQLSSHSVTVPLTMPVHAQTFLDEPSVDKEIDRITHLPLGSQPAAWGALDKEIETTYYPYVVTSYGRDVLLHGSAIGGINNDGVQAGMPTWKDLYVVR